MLDLTEVPRSPKRGALSIQAEAPCASELDLKVSKAGLRGACTYTHTDTYAYAYTYVYTSVRVYIYICMYRCTYVCTCRIDIHVHLGVYKVVLKIHAIGPNNYQCHVEVQLRYVILDTIAPIGIWDHNNGNSRGPYYRPES